MVEWETEEVTPDPLYIITANDPVTCSIYTKENKLIWIKGLKIFKKIAKRKEKVLLMANQAKLWVFQLAPR